MKEQEKRVAQRIGSRVSALAEIGIVLEAVHGWYDSFKRLLEISKDESRSFFIRGLAAGQADVIGLLEARFMTLYQEEATEREQERFLPLFTRLGSQD